MAYPYNGILFDNKKECSTDACYMDEPLKHYFCERRQTQEDSYCTILLI